MLSYQKWGLSAVWSGDSDGVEDKQSPQVQFQFFILIFFFFYFEKKKTKQTHSNSLTSGHVLFSEQLSTVFHFLFSFVLSFSLFLGTSRLWMGWRRSCSSSFPQLFKTCWLVTRSCVFIVAAFLLSCWTVARFHRRALSLSLSLSLPPSSLELHLNLETHVLSMQGVSLQSSVWDLWWLTGNFSVHVKGAFFKREKSELERTRTLIKSCDLKRGGGGGKTQALSRPTSLIQNCCLSMREFVSWPM